MLYVAISILIHLSIFFLISVRIASPRKDEAPQSIEIVHKPAVKSKPVKLGDLGVGAKGQSYSSERFNEDVELDNARSEMQESNILNKKEHRFYSYFERVKRQVEPPWAKTIIAHIGKQKLYSKYRTIILAIFDKEGNVVKVLLVESSGRDGFDQIAMRSMLGQVIPNPPKDLIDKDGYGRILWYLNVN